MLPADLGRGLRGCGSLLLRQRLLQLGEARQEVVAAHGQIGVGAQGENTGGGVEAEFAGHALAERGVQFGFLLNSGADGIIAAHDGVQLFGGNQFGGLACGVLFECLVSPPVDEGEGVWVDALRTRLRHHLDVAPIWWKVR